VDIVGDEYSYFDNAEFAVLRILVCFRFACRPELEDA
jgi:hypothetical protein